MSTIQDNLQNPTLLTTEMEELCSPGDNSMNEPREAEDPLLNLTWTNFQHSLATEFADLRHQEDLVDVTLVTGRQRLFAHKLVLCAASPWFKTLLMENPCKHPIIILNESHQHNLRRVLDFIYSGHVQVPQTVLPTFLQFAKLLRIKGLGDPNPEQGENNRHNHSATHQKHPTGHRYSTLHRSKHKLYETHQRTDHQSTEQNKEYPTGEIEPKKLRTEELELRNFTRHCEDETSQTSTSDNATNVRQLKNSSHNESSPSLMSRNSSQNHANSSQNYTHSSQNVITSQNNVTLSQYFTGQKSPNPNRMDNSIKRSTSPEERYQTPSRNEQSPSRNDPNPMQSESSPDAKYSMPSSYQNPSSPDEHPYALLEPKLEIVDDQTSYPEYSTESNDMETHYERTYGSTQPEYSSMTQSIVQHCARNKSSIQGFPESSHNSSTEYNIKVPPDLSMVPYLPRQQDPELPLQSPYTSIVPQPLHSLDARFCHLCGKHYSNSSNLKQHIRLIHIPGLLFCPLCQKGFKNKLYLRRHVISYHENA